MLGLVLVASAGPARAAGATVPPSSEAPVSPAPATPSAGCSAAPGAADRDVPLTVGDTAGRYLLHVPPGKQGPLPVVISMHGYSSSVEVQVQLTGLGPFGDTAGFVTVTPQITRDVPRWVLTPRGPDVAFIGAVLDDVAATTCVDTSRVYVAGMSNGAMMTSRLACDLSDRVAAFAMVTGLLDPPECTPGRPVPVLAIHGTADPFVPYDGGVGPGVALLPSADGSGPIGTVPDAVLPPEMLTTVPQRIAAWAARDGCDATVTPDPVSDDVDEFDYTCPAGVDVQLWRVDGGGHTWPGSQFLVAVSKMVGPTTMSVSANEVIWAFFQRFTVPGS